ncbi:hypothetical protein [Helicobacter himalayensis]|uniref:hypothetical protein n=1 Tax=Helicobacter himalayensis TaxID=1591088 RepID=UPI000AF3A3EE|nr:hypothetical protein [Helicobacter himalayensis]
MDEKQINLLVKRLSRKFSWLSSCMQHFDVTDIGEQHDLTHLLTSKASQKDKYLTKQINIIAVSKKAISLTNSQTRKIKTGIEDARTIPRKSL